MNRTTASNCSPTLSVAELVNLITALQRDAGRYTALEQHCVAAAKVLCWEEEAPRLLAIYRDLESAIPSG